MNYRHKTWAYKDEVTPISEVPHKIMVAFFHKNINNPPIVNKNRYIILPLISIYYLFINITTGEPDYRIIMPHSRHRGNTVTINLGL